MIPEVTSFHKSVIHGQIILQSNALAPESTRRGIGYVLTLTVREVTARPCEHAARRRPSAATLPWDAE
jgi:hypothetical protein